MAITGDTKQQVAAIVDVGGGSHDAIATVFAQVLEILGQEGLIGRDMFAIDGAKFPSNGSTDRSGTEAEFLTKDEKLCRC